jgi:hypothetical protein
MNKNLFSDMQNELPRAIACAIYPQGGERECMVSLAEVGRLLDTAGAEMVATVTQMRDKPDGVSCIGSGKLKELSGEGVDESKQQGTEHKAEKVYRAYAFFNHLIIPFTIGTAYLYARTYSEPAA